MYSPPMSVFVAASSDHSSISVRPGSSALRTFARPASHTVSAAPMHAELVRGLDLARVFQRFLAVEEVEPQCLERGAAFRIDVVDRQAAIGAALRTHQVVDLLCPLRNHLLLAVGDAEVVPERAAPRLADRFDAVGEMLAVAIVEDRGFALRRHEAIARGVVHRPDRHVARAGRVADVDRVVEQDPGVVARAQFPLHAPEAIEAQPRHVDIVAVVDQAERRLAAAPGAAGRSLG